MRSPTEDEFWNQMVRCSHCPEPFGEIVAFGLLIYATILLLITGE